MMTGMKGKILLVIALYIILGIIAFFNFGFHRYIFSAKIDSKKAVHIDYQESFNENE